MSIDTLVRAAVERAEVRFTIDLGSAILERINGFTTSLEGDTHCLRLKRRNKESSGWRTILVGSLHDKLQIPSLFRWAADVRDILSEPETSDLYLILEAPALSPEEILRIESNEHFCRKFAMDTDTNPQTLLSKTFLVSTFERTSDQALFDPLLKALQDTERSNIWLTRDLRLKWRELLLSGASRDDIVRQLVGSTPDEAE